MFQVYRLELVQKRYIFIYVHLEADCGTDGIESYISSMF